MNRAHSGEFDRVDDLLLSQDGAQRTHQSVLKISRNTAIRRYIVSWSHHLRFFPRSFHLNGKQRAYSVGNVVSGSVARVRP